VTYNRVISRVCSLQCIGRRLRLLRFQRTLLQFYSRRPIASIAQWHRWFFPVKRCDVVNLSLSFFVVRLNTKLRHALCCAKQHKVGAKILHTLRLKKVYPLMFDNKFGKCGPIFKIFSPVDSQENALCIQYNTKISTSPAVLLHYLVKFKNPKMLPNFHAERNN